MGFQGEYAAQVLGLNNETNTPPVVPSRSREEINIIKKKMSPRPSLVSICNAHTLFCRNAMKVWLL